MRGLRHGAPARLLALAACEARSPGRGRNSILRAAGQPVGGSAVPVGRSRGSAPCRRDMAARPMPPGPRACDGPVTRYQRSPKYRPSQELRRHGGPGRRVLHCAGRRDLRDPWARRRRPDRHGRVHPGPGTPGSGRAGVPGLNPAGDRSEPRQRSGAQLQDSQLPRRPGVGHVLQLHGWSPPSPPVTPSPGRIGPGSMHRIGPYRQDPFLSGSVYIPDL